MYGDAVPKRPYMAITFVLQLERFLGCVVRIASIMTLKFSILPMIAMGGFDDDANA